MKESIKLKAHDKAFAKMHSLQLEIKRTKLKIEGKLPDKLNKDQLEIMYKSQIREYDTWNYIATLIEKDYGKHDYVDEILGYQRDYDTATAG